MHIYIATAVVTLGYCGIKQSCYGMIRVHSPLEKSILSVSMGVIYKIKNTVDIVFLLKLFHYILRSNLAILACPADK